MIVHMPKVVKSIRDRIKPRANDLFPIGKARHEEMHISVTACLNNRAWYSKP